MRNILNKNMYIALGIVWLIAVVFLAWNTSWKFMKSMPTFNSMPQSEDIKTRYANISPGIIYVDWEKGINDINFSISNNSTTNWSWIVQPIRVTFKTNSNSIDTTQYSSWVIIANKEWFTFSVKWWKLYDDVSKVDINIQLLTEWKDWGYTIAGKHYMVISSEDTRLEVRKYKPANWTINTWSTSMGIYKGYLDGSQTPFITTASISKIDALQNCMTNHTNNPTSPIRCTWEGTEIYIFVPAPIVAATWTINTGAVSTWTVNLQNAVAFGVYEGGPRGFQQHPEQPVYLAIPTSVQDKVLVLTAYEPVNWVLRNPHQVKFLKIITAGYYAQRVSTSDNSMLPIIENNSFISNGPTGYAYAYKSSDDSFKRLASFLKTKNITLTANNFIGSYSAKDNILFTKPASSLTNTWVVSWEVPGQKSTTSTPNGWWMIGIYKGYLNGSQTPFITTASISKTDALQNCMTNHTNNSTSSIRCTWEGAEIYIFIPAPISTVSICWAANNQSFKSLTARNTSLCSTGSSVRNFRENINTASYSWDCKTNRYTRCSAKKLK